MYMFTDSVWLDKLLCVNEVGRSEQWMRVSVATNRCVCYIR